MIKLPLLPLRASVLICASLICASVGALVATPRLVEVENPPSLEEQVPRQFGDWKEKPNPYVQVGLATGNEPNINQPYDQTVMRTYVNSQGNMVMLALAWGRKQQQEVKIHRPDLCYVAQGYKVESLTSVTFTGISGANGPLRGKRMVAMNNRSGEAVSYWIRIGTLYSEDAIDTRLHILKEGLSGRIPDGILVRASQPIRNEHEAENAWPVLEGFLAELSAAMAGAGQSRLLLGSSI